MATLRYRQSVGSIPSKSRRLLVKATPIFLAEPLETRRLLSGVPAFTSMVVFGDSLSDTGNDGYFTSSTTSQPPSAETGVWHEILADDLGIARVPPSSQGGQNWAYGGAVTGNGTSGEIDNVGLQVSNYLASVNNSVSGSALYAIWAGANDVMYAAEDAVGSITPHEFDQVAITAADNLEGYIQTLISDGAKYIVWPNLPAIAKTPEAAGLSTATQQALGNATSAFNTEWASDITALRNNPNVTIYGLDAYTLFNEMGNGTYPGYTFGNTTGEASQNPGAPSADTYLFWDDIHPTEKAHQLLGDAAYDLIAPQTPPTATIAGTIYSDTNNSGVYSSADPGINDVMVYLDANNDGNLDAGDVSVNTNASGNYLFSNLAAGTYTVREVVPGNYVQTAPVSGAISVTVATGRASTGNTFLDAPTGNATTEAVYRLYSPVTLEHLYTTDANEYNTLESYVGTWNGEGQVFSEYSGAGTVGGVADEPYYRLYNPSVLQHLWTTDLNEYTVLATEGWNQEGIVGYVFPATPGSTATTLPTVPGSQALYRLRAPNVHVWTTTLNEYDTLQTEGWTGEGIIGYVL